MLHFTHSAQEKRIRRLVTIVMFSIVGSSLYAMYDIGVMFSEIRIPLGFVQQLSCVFFNILTLGFLGTLACIPFAMVSVRQENQNWVGFLIGYASAYGASIVLSEEAQYPVVVVVPVPPGERGS